MKKLLLLSLTTLLLITGCSKKTVDEPKEDVTLTVWSTAEEVGKFKEGFEKKYSNIKLDIQVLSNDDYMTKLINTLKSGKSAPDVFTAESDYVKRLIETPYMEDLTKFGFDKTKANMWDYVVNVGTDSNNVIKALSWQASPGGLIYRTDIAKEVLNVKTSEEMQSKLSSMQGILDVAKELKSKDVKMFASWEDLLNLYFSNRSNAWVVNKKMIEFMNLAKEIHENGYSLNASPWDGEWFAGVNNDDTFGYVLPTWGYQFVVKPTAEKTTGKWGLTQMEVPYIKGGTWMGMFNGSEKKDAAWKFIEYVTMDEESLESYAKESGEFVSIKSVNEKLAKEEGDAVLDNQNSYEFFNKLMMQEIPDFITEYDGSINDMFLASTRAYVEGKLSLDDALKQFKADVKNAFADLVVE